MLYLYIVKNTLKKHVIIKNGEKKKPKRAFSKRGVILIATVQKLIRIVTFL